MNDAAGHWEHVYRTKAFDAVSWYAPHLHRSLELIAVLAPNKDAAILDVGGGESTLVDDLLDRGYRDLSVLDVSATAIAHTRARLGDRAGAVDWIVGDIRDVELADSRFDLWHDRAVFHFLTDAGDRAAYVRRVRAAVRPGGTVLMATFGPEGPTRCSGLDVVRYDAESLHEVFGDGFALTGSGIERHGTPGGAEQQFLYCWCRVG